MLLFKRKIFESETTKLISSNEKLHDIMKILKSIKDSSLLIKDGTSLLENMFAENGVKRGGSEVIWRRKLSWSRFSKQPHPFTTFEIQKFCSNEPKFNSVFSRIILPEIKYGSYVIKLVELKPIGNNWTALYVKSNNEHTLIYLELKIFQNK